MQAKNSKRQRKKNKDRLWRQKIRAVVQPIADYVCYMLLYSSGRDLSCEGKGDNSASGGSQDLLFLPYLNTFISCHANHFSRTQTFILGAILPPTLRNQTA